MQNNSKIQQFNKTKADRKVPHHNKHHTKLPVGHKKTNSSGLFDGQSAGELHWQRHKYFKNQIKRFIDKKWNSQEN